MVFNLAFPSRAFPRTTCVALPIGYLERTLRARLMGVEARVNHGRDVH